MDFNNKVVFVAGSARGIGKAVVEVFAGYGATVVAADMDKEGVNKVAENVSNNGGKCIGLQVDVTDIDSVKKGLDEAVKEFNTVDVLVYVAGVAIQRKLEDVTEAEFNKMYDVNVRGMFNCCRTVMPIMKENGGGKIVAVSSNNYRLGEYGNGVYCSTKSAVSMLTLIMGLEWAEYNITANAIAPGIVDTEMLSDAIVEFSKEAGVSPEEYRREWASSIPMKRLCKPEEVAELAAFLASDKSSYISGITCNIDGGTPFI